MRIKTADVSFGGYECVKVENESLTLWVTKSAGPRILGLSFQGRENIFAELPGVALSVPGQPDYMLRGGHRLWCAPEDPKVTYRGNDNPVAVELLDDTLHVIQPEDKYCGVQKTISIRMDAAEAKVRVNHSLTNTGTDTLELAPWAITQLRLGGTAILPQAQGDADEYGVLPNRQLTLWPYTQMKAPYVDWGDDFVLVHADFPEGSFKVGFPNPRGWIGYVINGQLFVKNAVYYSGASYYDAGSSSECYCNHQFLELETLGPKTVLEPGQAVHHREDWAMYSGIEFQPTEESARQLAEKLNLG